MTEPLPTDEPLARLVTALADADGTRLAAIIITETWAGTTVFTRHSLTALWAVRYRQHNTGPASRRPPRRVDRSVPVLQRIPGLSADADNGDIVVTDMELIEFVAVREHVAVAVERQNPMSNVLPVGTETVAEALALVEARMPPPVDPPDGPPGVVDAGAVRAAASARAPSGGKMAVTEVTLPGDEPGSVTAAQADTTGARQESPE